MTGVAVKLEGTDMSASDIANRNTGRLTTHVLDTASGKPAESLAIDLFRLDSGDRKHLKSVTTNNDGRCDKPLLSGKEVSAGEYELVFDVGRYFHRTEATPFLSTVPVRFGIADPNQHYHIPLLVSPFGYSTYRGS